jgi:hypothetical protein
MLSSLRSWWHSLIDRPQLDVLDVIPEPDLEASQRQS